MNAPTTVHKTLIDNLPAGLERALLRILNYHIGANRAIGREELMLELKNMGFPMRDDRPVRALINDMRKRGFLICSRGGEGGGYWLAANRAEVEEYLEREVHPRAMDLLETEKALRSSMEQNFGQANQARLL